MFYSSAAYIDEQGRLLWEVKARHIKENAYFSLLNGNFIVFSSTVMKRECLDLVGLFDFAISIQPGLGSHHPSGASLPHFSVGPGPGDV